MVSRPVSGPTPSMGLVVPVERWTCDNFLSKSVETLDNLSRSGWMRSWVKLSKQSENDRTFYEVQVKAQLIESGQERCLIMTWGFTNRFLAKVMCSWRMEWACERHANLQDVFLISNLSTHIEKHVQKQGRGKQEQLRIHDTTEEQWCKEHIHCLLGLYLYSYAWWALGRKHLNTCLLR